MKYKLNYKAVQISFIIIILMKDLGIPYNAIAVVGSMLAKQIKASEAENQHKVFISSLQEPGPSGMPDTIVFITIKKLLRCKTIFKGNLALLRVKLSVIEN